MGEIFPWLHEVENLAERHGFFHWELQFSHLFKNRGGFDIQVGNPPWVRPNWDEDAVLAEFDPWFKLAEKSPAESKFGRKNELLKFDSRWNEFLNELSGIAGLSDFLSGEATYPPLVGTQPDLYRAFMCRSWGNMGEGCNIGLVHPNTHFGGVRERHLRRESYARLKFLAFFVNGGNWAFSRPVGDTAEFGVHVYGDPGVVGFDCVNRIYSPSVVAGSFVHDGLGEVPGIKYHGDWDIRPHKKRVVHVDEGVLGEWSKVTAIGGVSSLEAPLLFPVSSSEAGAISAIAAYCGRLGADIQIASGYHEAGAKKDGLIRWNSSRPIDLHEAILQGPHFSQATPYAKIPMIPCKSTNDWVSWDISSLPESAIPLCNYERAGCRSDYLASQDSWNKKRYTEYYRLAWRRRIAFNTERSLFAALIPPGPAHVDAVHSMWAGDNQMTVLNTGFWASLPLDYLLRITGRSDLRNTEAYKMPAPTPGHLLETALLVRSMRLNCLTNAYAPLWAELYDESWQQETWAVNWPRLAPLGEVGPEWEYASPLRTEYERRAALVELDALVSVWLGISADELTAVYKSRYPVLHDYEADIHFDANGRKIAKNHNTYGYGQTKEDFLHLKKYLDKDDPTDTVPEGYAAPFYDTDREREYREAHAHFTEIVERAKRDGTWDGEV
ncbi:Eco57I restriction-modification methylase domain-containing protein [Nocardiopsis halotolerans]